jgi:hypothetical protein
LNRIKFKYPLSIEVGGLNFSADVHETVIMNGSKREECVSGRGKGEEKKKEKTKRCILTSHIITASK